MLSLIVTGLGLTQALRTVLGPQVVGRLLNPQAPSNFEFEAHSHRASVQFCLPQPDSLNLETLMEKKSYKAKTIY